ncbi:MAG: leucine-rich repeat protein [Oscillospiraceae bacterium]|nr:leucine-rich repeat protein [Oscillospiraceae bacterium]MBR3535190.1 leucine-rich repeat protein [Oscillospiraceae bacterium]MBR6837187.1 leucine-rich repeat protein [Oscillospiraceae bacterium]
MKKERIIRTTACVLTAAMAFGAYLPAGIISVPAPVHAEDAEYTLETSGPIQYYKYADHAEIIGFSMDETSVDIPETLGGVPVTVIGMYAFNGCKLKSVVIPDSVKEIGNYAFTMSDSLESVTFGNGLEKIGIKAFEMCSKLGKVTFPDHLVEMNTLVFDSTPWLEAKRKESDMVIVNGDLIDGLSCKGDVVIPSEVTFVSPGAFERNEDITSVVYHSKIKEVGADTFFYCSNLKSADLRGVESIGVMAFDGCTALKELKVSGKLSSVGDYAFSDGPSSGTITVYGTKEEWEKVPKTEDFLKNSQVVFEEVPSEPEDPEDPKEPEDVVLGDVNLDGTIDVTDLSVLAISLVDKKELTGTAAKNADVDKDGKVALTDLATIRQYISKKITKF